MNEQSGTGVSDIAQQSIESFAKRIHTIRDHLHQVVVGQDDTIDLLLVCSLTGSHALLVGVPGLAKTLMVKALASTFDWRFSRIQFTPDLMPSDITGYELLSRDVLNGATGPTARGLHRGHWAAPSGNGAPHVWHCKARPLGDVKS